MNLGFDPIALSKAMNAKHPGWWTPRESKPVDSHSGVLVEYKSKQQKWRKVQAGEKGFALVHGAIIDVYVHSKERRDDKFTLVVMPTLRAERYDVDIDHYSRARGRLKEKVKVCQSETIPT